MIYFIFFVIHFFNLQVHVIFMFCHFNILQFGLVIASADFVNRVILFSGGLFL